MKKTLISIIIFICLVSLPVLSQETCELINLNQSIKMALNKNLNMKIASQDYKIAEAKTVQAWSSIFPSLTLSTSYSKYKSAVTSGIETESNSVKLSFEQLIYSGSAFAAIKASTYGIELAEKNFLNKANNVIYNTTKSYYDLIKLSSLLQATEENKKLIQESLEKVSTMVKSGISNRQDLLRMEIQLNSIEQKIIDLNMQYNTAIKGFNISIGLPVETAIRAVTQNTYEIDIKSRDSYIEQALNMRPDLKALHYQKELYETQISAIASETQPTLLATGYTGATDEKYDFDFDDDQDWMVTLALSWNIFDGNNSGSRIKENKATIYKITEQEKNLKEVIVLEIESALLQIRSAENKIKTARKEVELARENQYIANINYVNGAATNIEVIDSNASLLLAQSNFITAEYELALAQANLEKVLGTSYTKIFN